MRSNNSALIFQFIVIVPPKLRPRVQKQLTMAAPELCLSPEECIRHIPPRASRMISYEQIVFVKINFAVGISGSVLSLFRHVDGHLLLLEWYRYGLLFH